MVAREPDSIVLSGFLCFSGSWEARLVMKTEGFRNMRAALTELDTDEAVRQAEERLRAAEEKELSGKKN